MASTLQPARKRLLESLRMALLVFVLAHGTAAVPAGETLVVIHKWADSLGFYDPQSGALLKNVPVGLKPHEMALSSNGRFLLIAQYGIDRYTEDAEGGRTLSVVELARREKTAELDLGRFRRPHGVERSRSGRFYVTVDNPASLLVVDAGGSKVLRDIPVGQSLPHMVAVLADETKAYVANSGSATVTAIALAGTQTNRHVFVGGVPMGLDLTRDNRRLYVANRVGNAVLVMDTKSDQIIGTIDIPGHPVRVRLSPDEHWLAVTLILTGEVAIVDVAKREVTRRFHAGDSAEGLLFDPSGRFLYVSAQGDNKVVKFSTTDWSKLLEIKTGTRPDTLMLLGSDGK
jgi:YVTN family beta-propeller protein